MRIKCDSFEPKRLKEVSKRVERIEERVFEKSKKQKSDGWLMRFLKRVLIFIFGTFVISGCTPKSAGYDSAYLNRTRGASGAQITVQRLSSTIDKTGLTADEI